MPPKSEQDRLVAKLKRTKKQIAKLRETLPQEEQLLNSIDRRLEEIDLQTCGLNALRVHVDRAKNEMREFKKVHKDEIKAVKETIRHAKRVQRENRVRRRLLEEEARWAAFPAKPNRRVVDLSSNAKIFDFLRRRGTTELEGKWTEVIASPDEAPSFDMCEEIMNGVFELMRFMQNEIEANPGTRFIFRKADRVEDLMVKLSLLYDRTTGFEVRFNIFIGDDFQTGIHNHSRSFFSHVIHGSYQHDLWNEHNACHCEDCIETKLFQRGWANGEVELRETNLSKFVCKDESRSHIRREGHVMFLDGELVHTVSGLFNPDKVGCEQFNGVTLVLLLPKNRPVSNFYVVGDDKDEFLNEKQVRIEKNDTWMTVQDLCQLVGEKGERRPFEVDLGCPM